jgi:hypothetical protein
VSWLGRLIGRRVNTEHVGALSEQCSPEVQLEALSEAFRCGDDEAVTRASAILAHGTVALTQSFKAVYHCTRHALQTPTIMRAVLRMLTAAHPPGPALKDATRKVYTVFIMKCILRFAMKSYRDRKRSSRILRALVSRHADVGSMEGVNISDVDTGDIATLLLQGLVEAVYDRGLQKHSCTPVSRDGRLSITRTAAHFATLLCRAGADPEGAPWLNAARGTPLQVAVLAQQHVLVRLLLREGAAPLRTCKQCSVPPGRLAARHPHTQFALEALLQADHSMALDMCEDAIEYQPLTALATLHAARRWMDADGKAEWNRRWRLNWKSWRFHT